MAAVCPLERKLRCAPRCQTDISGTPGVLALPCQRLAKAELFHPPPQRNSTDAEKRRGYPGMPFGLAQRLPDSGLFVRLTGTSRVPAGYVPGVPGRCRICDTAQLRRQVGDLQHCPLSDDEGVLDRVA